MQAQTTHPLGDDGFVAVRSTFLRKVFVVLAVLALLSAAISVAGKWIGREIAMAGHTDSRIVHEIVIGNDVLSVPANMIRFESARRQGVTNRLDLYVRWPDMTGYSDETRDDFNHLDGSKRILFLAFEQRMMSRDMSGRYEPIYRSLVESAGKPGPGGLTVHPFTAQSGYMDEVLIVGKEGASAPFVARCLAGEQARQSLAPCERDIHVGNGLNLVYRMPAELAGSWREVDAAVRKFAGSIIQN
jgi:hypothetical protein